MKSRLLILAAFALAAVPAFAGGLSFTLDPTVETGAGGSSVIFSGTLVDTDTDDSALFMNGIDVAFTPPAGSYLTADPNFFFNTAPGSLFGDGVTNDDTYTGPIFELDIAPGTPAGLYSGTIQILGGYNGPEADFDPLATQSFQVDVAPEPAAAGLMLAGLAGLAMIRRRLSSKA